MFSGYYYFRKGFIAKSNFKLMLDLISNLKEEINCVYGPASSGKTTLALMTAIETARNGKVLFIDTENGFSLDRFKQLAGQDYEKLLEKIFVLKVGSFEDQCKKVQQALKIADKFNLIIVDSLSIHYRKEIHKDAKKTNNELSQQMQIFSQITQDFKIPVLLTNQVYDNMDTNERTMVGGNMMKNWSKKLIELSINPRKLKILKPEVKEVNIEITEKGITPA